MNAKAHSPIPVGFAALLALAGLAHGNDAWWKEIDSAKLPSIDRPVEEVIDHYLDARLKEIGITPAPEAAAETLLRRVTLDLAGRAPTPTEAATFLANESPYGWNGVVDRLLHSPSFDRYLAYEWNWLLMEGQGGDFQKYLARAAETKASWDVIFADTVAGRADAPEREGADQFLRSRVRDLDKLSNDVSVLFFGVNVSCAQCHDHPYVQGWTQETYYGMKSFFGRTFDNGGFAAERAYGEISYKTTTGEERPVRPHFLGGAVIEEPAVPELTDADRKAEKERLEEAKSKKVAPPAPGYSRRARLIEAGLGDREGYFARSAVNRLWHRLFGHGLVMPLDQMHGANLPSHPELLQWLALKLEAEKFDLRPIFRGMVLSEAYRRESRWTSSDSRPAAKWFAMATPRPLDPRQYGIVLKMATADPGYFATGLSEEEHEKRIESLEKSGAGLASRFQRPDDEFQFPVDEALYFSNSSEVQGQLLNGGLVAFLDKVTSPEEKVRSAYQAILGRQPQADELAVIAEFLNARADRPNDAVRQMVWALLTSSECRFNS